MKTSGVISSWGNSQAVRLPKIMLESLGLKANDQVSISMMESKIVIEPARTRSVRKSLAERFKDFSGDYQPEELDTGVPVGSEIF